MQRSLRRPLGSLALAALILGTAACGGGADDTEDQPADSAAPSPDKESEAAGMVPDDIREAGKLVVGTDASYAPSEFFDEDGSTIIGMDVDLFDAVAAEMGLETDYQNADFGTIIGGVTSAKYDAGVSSFTVNAERKKEVTMVSYFNAGTQWAVASGNPKGVDPDSPCGLTVAVQADTVQDLEDLPPKIKACDGEGKKLTVQRSNGQDQATAALVSGKADAMLADSPVVSYAIQQVGGKIESVGDIYDAAPYGYVVPKKDTELADAMVTALEAVSKDGTYDKVLKKWGQSQGALDDFAVNP